MHLRQRSKKPSAHTFCKTKPLIECRCKEKRQKGNECTERQVAVKIPIIIMLVNGEWNRKMAAKKPANRNNYNNHNHINRRTEVWSK